MGVDQAPEAIGEVLQPTIEVSPNSFVLACDPISLDHLTDPDYGSIYKPAAVSEAANRVFQNCYESFRKATDRPVICIGGDHSIAIGSISGFFTAYQERTGSENIKWDEPLVIWFDAHADINTLKTTVSGHIHGCPVAFLMAHPDTKGLSEFNWFYSANEEYRASSGRRAFIEANRLAYIGLRDVEDGEKDTMKEYGIHEAWFMKDIEKIGRDIGTMMKRILGHLDPEGIRPIHLSLDVDGMDPQFTPSTGTPVPGGMSLNETLQIVQILKETKRLMSVDVVEVNLLLGSREDAEKTLKNTMTVIKQIISI